MLFQGLGNASPKGVVTPGRAGVGEHVGHDFRKVTVPAGYSDARVRGDAGVHRPTPVFLQDVKHIEQLRIHPNTVRFHLGALQRSGQVEQAPGVTTGPGRPPALFRATRRMDPAGPTNYRLLATMLTSQLAAGPEPTSTATSLGRAWGHRLVGPPRPPRPRRSGAQVRRAEALHRMVDMLDGLGFAPAALTGPRDTMIRVRHCPFLGVVNDPSGLDGERGGYGNVICALHLGVMQGALAALDAPVTVDRLDPFAEPDLCVAHLGPAKAGTGGDATADRTTAPLLVDRDTQRRTPTGGAGGSSVRNRS